MRTLHYHQRLTFTFSFKIHLGPSGHKWTAKTRRRLRLCLSSRVSEVFSWPLVLRCPYCPTQLLWHRITIPLSNHLHVFSAIANSGAASFKDCIRSPNASQGCDKTAPFLKHFQMQRKYESVLCRVSKDPPDGSFPLQHPRFIVQGSGGALLARRQERPFMSQG